MDANTSLKTFGLVPDRDAIDEIRSLLAREAKAEREGHGRERVEDLALLCCIQLFSRGNLADSLLICDAKSSGMDLGSSLDVQFLCGGGLNETKEFLTTHPSKAASEALRYIKECEAMGDFDGFSPAQFLGSYREYFGVA